MFAAGDVAGGCPQKYVTGALAEGEIAACSALEFLKQHTAAPIAESSVTEHAEEVQRFLTQSGSRFTTEQLEEAMQTVMDAYAGGIKTNYRFNEKQLKIADEKIVQLMQLSEQLHADDFQELMYIYELRLPLRMSFHSILRKIAAKPNSFGTFSESTRLSLLEFELFDDVVGQILHWDSFLFHGVAITNSYTAIFLGLEVVGDAEWGTDLILTAVTFANGTSFIIVNHEVLGQLSVQSACFFRKFLGQWQNACFEWSKCWMQVENNAGHPGSLQQ